MSTQPTDAELKAMWQLHAADIGGIFHYARAVLAKWGQPAQPVAREPMTSEQMLKLYLQSAMKERIFIRADWEQGVLDAEQYHGIKGGQHDR